MFFGVVVETSGFFAPDRFDFETSSRLDFVEVLSSGVTKSCRRFLSRSTI